MVQGALGGRSEVDYARCVLLLFCPWTTHPDDASAAVPYLGDLCKFGAPGKAGQKTLKRKLPSDLARLDCRGCKFRKLEHAFPRAQLQQDDSEAKRRCLKCLKEVESLNCSVCLGKKQARQMAERLDLTRSHCRSEK